MTQIADAISRIPDSLSPLRDIASRFARYPSIISDDAVLNIGQRPWIAPENYLLSVFPGIEQCDITAYEELHGVKIPKTYSAILNEIGGCFCLGLALYGIPRSMLKVPPTLDRKKLQCLDVGTANNVWSIEYAPPSNWFHLGSRHYSSSENCGYFVSADERIVSVLKGGEIVSEWRDFKSFLHDELTASEELENALHPPQWTDKWLSALAMSSDGLWPTAARRD